MVSEYKYKDIPIDDFQHFHETVTKYRSKTTLYRGIDDFCYDLKPRIGRRDKYGIRRNVDLLSLERRLLRWFRDRAIPYIRYPLEDDVQWLALGQHYGLPTRFLDWTRNPLVAAFFAVNEENDCNSAVYVLKMQRGLISKGDSYKPNKNYRESPFQFDKIWKYAPPHFDNRIIAQASVFTIHTDPEDPYPFEKHEVDKIIIPNNLRKAFKKILNRYGVNQYTLFPGLDTLSEHITWLTTGIY